MPDIIMSIQDVIDAALPDETTNCTVNFRLLKTLVVILANQLRVLNRHVQVNVDSGVKYPQTNLRPSLVVSEIKVQVEDESKKRSKERKKELRKRTEAERGKEGGRKKQRESKDLRKEVNVRNELRSSKSITPYSPPSSAKSGDEDEEEPVIQERATVIRKTTGDNLEELREREIRIINQVKLMQWELTRMNFPLEALVSRAVYEQTQFFLRFDGSWQRADSHEDPALSPSPMASVHSMGKENLLIVSPQGRTPKLNLVTKDQFDGLVEIVHQLQARFEPIGIPGFPENAEFLKALRSGASLTEAMAALQMSARLQAFEKAFVIMMSLLTDLAKKTPGVDVSQFQDMEANLAQGGRISEINMATRAERLKENQSSGWVSHEEFNNAMHELYEEVEGMVKERTKTIDTDRKNETLINQLERKIQLLNYGERFEVLEADMSEYAEKFINLDISLSTQIASYQEQLTQMQYQLESGIENILEKVAHVRSDPDALLEFNVRLDALQQDVENAALEQKNLKGLQNNMTFDLARLWKEIELIRDAKADREEVEDALRDKAGIRDLNGMVMVNQFDAAFGELEAKINNAHQKFNDQELVWQTALDDFNKSINEKGDYIHICALRDDINRHLNNLRDKIDGLIEVVGAPRAAVTRKKLFSHTDCACCGTPAVMNMEVPVPRLPDFKRASADGAETPDMPKDDGDHALCIPDHPIPQSGDQKCHMCHRFCGGSHTLLPPLPRAPPRVTISNLPRNVTLTTTIGSDRKIYKTDEWDEKKPCKRCNIPKATKATSQPSKKEDASEPVNAKRNTLSFEMSWLEMPKHSNGSDYATLPLFEEDM